MAGGRSPAHANRAADQTNTRNPDKAGLSQGDVAARLGRTQTYFSRVERGAQGLETVELLDFCAAIGTGPSKLIRAPRVSRDRHRVPP
ncbi:MAG: XRE family transcriptional regulator [Alphaproteobacteria bacterium]|nr:MAG: XRE family transcriptional regulator [Alphaproteobacteria bacterium]